LSCVVLIDLAIYMTVALGAFSAKRMNPLAEKIMAFGYGAIAGCPRGTILVQRAESE